MLVVLVLYSDKILQEVLLFRNSTSGEYANSARDTLLHISIRSLVASFDFGKRLSKTVIHNRGIRWLDLPRIVARNRVRV